MWYVCVCFVKIKRSKRNRPGRKAAGDWSKETRRARIYKQRKRRGSHTRMTTPSKGDQLDVAKGPNMPPPWWKSERELCNSAEGMSGAGMAPF